MLARSLLRLIRLRIKLLLLLDEPMTFRDRSEKFMLPLEIFLKEEVVDQELVAKELRNNSSTARK